ncbi:acyltransferase family protein [Aliikangiella marina]|uniref:Acyltransferase family protein n=1 Tax=Aliikangiella marina TaxID=1712262 RepID=A0A545TH50_9GAMM|nr:acyltransferase family protein [Aliikangiella marina]TQV76560.1 acyltransferase family protein [Aliikangiella marina]
MSNANIGESFARPNKNENKNPQKVIEHVSSKDNNIDSVGVVRYHYMDNLRAIAMVAGVFFHAALAYSPLMQNLWLSADPQNSMSLDAVAWFSHLFRMPLFFLISGFFAMMLIDKRGIGGFLKNRFLRIGLPFIVFLPLVIISFIALVGFALAEIQPLSPMLQMIAATQSNPDIPQPPFSTTHLWFLFNLLQFTIVLALLQRFTVIRAKLYHLTTSIPFLLIVLPLIITPSLYSQALPHPAPERIYPEIWSFGFYGLFFLVGVSIFKNQSVIDALNRYIWLLFGGSLLAYRFVYLAFPESLTIMDMLPKVDQGFSLNHFVIAFLEALVAVYMTLFCLVVGRKLLNDKSKTMRLISDSSYWIYIVHLPVLFYIQFLLLETNWNIWVEFLISSLGTLMIGLVSYFVLVKWTPIGWMLNGKK